MAFLSLRTRDDPSLSADVARHVQQVIERNRRRNRHSFPAGGSTHPIRRVGVVGAGFMGSLVAGAAVEHGRAVVITDQDAQTLSASARNIHKALEETRRTVDPSWQDSIHELVRTTSDMADVADCDLVVETVVEDPHIKQRVFAELEAHRSRDTIIVSNTSTLPITQLASTLSDPARFCGLHFFPPLGEQPMLEIIPGSRTSGATVGRVIEFSEAINRIPVVVPDGRGFIVNRLIMAYMSAGMRLLAFGIDAQRIDRVALDFGMRLGPIRLCDEIGLDVVLNAAWSLAAESESLVARSPVLVRLVKARQLGRKTGRGFYVHCSEEADESAGEISTEAVQQIAKYIDREEHLSDEELTCAIILPIVAEATRLLAEHRARDAGQIDLAAMFGLGFPVWRGGLLYWTDQVGVAKAEEMLASLSHLGPHLQSTPTLAETADRNGRLYDAGEVVGDKPATVRSAATGDSR